MERSYGLSDKGSIYVINVLKQIITTAGATIRRYNQRNLQYHQNNMFRNDEKQFCKELEGKICSKLWSEPVEQNRDSEWLKKVKEKLRDTPKQENVIITVKELKWALARMKGSVTRALQLIINIALIFIKNNFN